MESITEQLKGMLEQKKIFKSGNLFKCILGLNEIETNVFSYLLKNDNASTIELAKALEKDRSSIQRALQNLNDLNVIDRKSMSLKEYVQQKGTDETNKRGYLYVYGAKDLKTIKKEFRELLNRWYRKMTDYIENIDSLFDCYKEDGELC